MKRKIVTIIFSLTMALGLCTTAFAYGWETDDIGTYYWSNKDNTEWYADGWYWVPIDESGKSYCYYFDENGYILKNTEINGWNLNEDGIWVIDNIPQTMKTSIPADYLDIPNSNEGLSNSSLAGKYYRYRKEKYYDDFFTVSAIDEDTLSVIYYDSNITGAYSFSSPIELTKRSENSYMTGSNESIGEEMGLVRNNWDEYVFNADGTVDLYIVTRKKDENGDFYDSRSFFQTYKKKEE